MLERGSDPHSGRCDVSPRQLDERETGLGIPTALVRGEKSFLGAIEITSVLANATELGERPAELAAQIRTQLLAGPEGLLLRLRACSAEPQNFGAVNATAPMQTPD